MTAQPTTPAAPVRAFVEELVRSGVRHAVICPGSRSTPLALALALEPGIRCFTHIDERAAAFFALGLAKATRRAVAMVGTSGTAVVNFGPAVVEASEGRTPLLVLTADRPPELRDRGAPQTIDQDHLYGRHVKWYVELPVPEATAAGDVLERHIRGVVGRAVAIAQEQPAGPVHLNLPFREPLVPVGDLQPRHANDPSGDRPGPEPDAFVGVVTGPRRPDQASMEELAGRVRAAANGLIVCGPLDRPGIAPALARLADSSGFPILADGLSNMRVGSHDRSHVVARHDAIVRSDGFRSAHRPELVIRFGGTPTSKALLTMLQEDAPAQIAVDDGGWNEPTLRPVTMVHADPVAFASDLAERLDQLNRSGPLTRPGPPGGGPAGSAWLSDWLEADRVADEAIGTWLDALEEPFEGSPFAELPSALPDGAILLAGNSMPVRDLDAFLPPGSTSLRCLGNRGANGIDGVVSTALGVAATGIGPVILVVGDVSFLHDLNALVAARLHDLSATIVLMNNDGGGIFSFLPQAVTDRPEVGLPDHYEALFGTPHGIDVGPIVGALGGEHRLVGTGQLGPAIRASIAQPGVRVLEVRTDRRRNVELHRACVEAIRGALDQLADHASDRAAPNRPAAGVS